MTNKGDLISREAVDDAIYDYSRACAVDYAQIMAYIDKIPSVENKGEDRPKGEWKRKVHYLDICWECSNCGHNSNYYSPLYNFCPDCGADMRGE